MAEAERKTQEKKRFDRVCNKKKKKKGNGGPERVKRGSRDQRKNNWGKRVGEKAAKKEQAQWQPIR